MIPVSELCRSRHIRSLDITTPLLIPSFSSKGFPYLKNMTRLLKDHITDVAMISSYDIYYDNLEKESVNPTLLFIDSGGYEARQDYDIAEVYASQYSPKAWTREYHKEVLRTLDLPAALVLVSFDEIVPEIPIAEQIEQAEMLFAQHPKVTSDFLIKPCGDIHIDPQDVILHIERLASFDAVGFTEKEIGATTLERLHNVVQIRQALTQAGLETPIHIFGCLDPLSVLLFYLCGADMFDGLSWLRFVFEGSKAIYRNNWAVIADYLNFSETDIEKMSWHANLTTLMRLRINMARYASSFDLSTLDADQCILRKTLNAVNVKLDVEEVKQ